MFGWLGYIYRVLADSFRAQTLQPAGKDASSSDAISCISSADAASTAAKDTEMNQGAYMRDQGMYYYGYYYPGV